LSENRWALHVAVAAASRGKINVVADATLSPTAARAYARSILAAADDAERQGSAAAMTDTA
jgi:dTDP-4-dehydrorhamnose reductase